MYTARVLFRNMRKGSGSGASTRANPAPPSRQSDRMGMEHPDFKLRRVVVVSKLSRYAFEKRRHSNLSEPQLEAVLRNQGSDFDVILKHHSLHKNFEDRVMEIFLSNGIEAKAVDRFTYTDQLTEWADMVVSAGGDGTFLLAASRVRDRSKPVVGFNSDPSRSEGFLCLPTQFSNNLEEAVRRLKGHEFEWWFRSRIRVTLTGESVHLPPTELHEEELKAALPSYRMWEPHMPEEPYSGLCNVRRLPVLALNEVFIGETLSARVSYFELRADSGLRTKVKSSGLCVTTGTGSTSWHASINRLTEQNVEDILRLRAEQAGFAADRAADAEVARRITRQYNDSLVFSPEDPRMCYTIRDLISGAVWPQPWGVAPRAFAERVEVCSRCFNGVLVIDGGLSFPFNDGTLAELEVHPEDALRTVRMTVPAV